MFDDVADPTIGPISERELRAFVVLSQALGDDADRQDAVVYGIPGHNPDAWSRSAKLADVDGYRAYVAALETAVDTVVVLAEAQRDSNWRRRLGGMT